MATNTTKRRLINQLPVVNQTDTLKNFFAATIDNLFQPGASEPISGYIGQKPVYYDSTKDYYLAESTDTRAAYQLEPAMISSNSGGVITDSLCYDDLINYLRSQGANTTNHSRMFEGDYYSWAPPVDIDKLNNYTQYVWLGSLTDVEYETSIITLRAPRSQYSYDGDTTKTYALPPANTGYQATSEYPIVLVNGAEVSASFYDGKATIVTTALAIGDIIETIRYGDLTKLLIGKTSFDLSDLLTWKSTIPNYATRNLAVANEYKAGQLAYAKDPYGVPHVYLCTHDHTAAVNFTDQMAYWRIADGLTSADKLISSTGMHIRIIDGIGTTVSDGRCYFIDGVGTSIELTADYSKNAGGTSPHHVVIDRRSNEKSPWTLRNLWVHLETLKWAGGNIFDSRKATRPIIEFLPNIELYNYGTKRLPDVQGKLTSTQATVIDNWDLYPNDDNVWDQEKVNLSRLNGKFFGKLDNQNRYIGSVVVDDGYVLQPNDLLFVNQAITNEPQLNNLIYQVVSNQGSTLPDTATVDAIELVLLKRPERGDIFRITSSTQSIFADPKEYWYNGIEWIEAQTGASIPQFMLYDSDKNKLDDTNVYANSSFYGSSIFAYKVGTGTSDTVLGFPLVHNSYGQPTFFIDSVVNRVTYLNGTVGGYYYHHFVDTDTYSNNWFAANSPSTQSLVNGVYSIPLNLQANPGNFEITDISRNQWFDHFSGIMNDQVGFTGNAYSGNNWRDTKKDLGGGNKILQHRSPLLKTMLLSSNSNYDLPASMRYAEQEYVRYRNKFVQMIIDLRNNGILSDSDTPTLWVDTILQNLRLNKTTDFAFSGSRVAGDQFFIPPTPATMGLSPVTKPGLVWDTTYATPVLMIRGHDGSLTPAFEDMRDPIMVEFENRIYNNIPVKFKTEARPIFDLKHYIGGKFYSDDLGYSRFEIDTMLSPFFQRWVQVNRLDYRNNSAYDPGNPFSWNYKGTLDADGNAVPGNWRGIYTYYFDTDRPHVAPWEMLGFAEKPDWWGGQYGAEPYTRGNTKLWNDLRDGRIRDGIRKGIDARYARPNLYAYLPVNEEGLLLNPIDCGIIPNAPTIQLASAPWSVGDYSPVEALWRGSASYSFAEAQVGFLIKPARFVEQGWDTVEQVQDTIDQWIYSPTGNRPLETELSVHGETASDGSKVINVGVQQWISDYIVYRGQSPKNFGDAIRGLQVRLAHKMAGFTTSNNLRVVADNFGLVPSENIMVQLYDSPSTREEVYSGVLIEWTGMGWRVIGYDTQTPHFTIIPGHTTGPKGIISLSDVPEPAVNSWGSNIYYPVNTNVVYMNVVYTCINGHTSSSAFEQAYWAISTNLPPQAPRVTTYLTADNSITETVPYGTVFTTYQAVSDFLLGYGRYLNVHGWLFENVNTSTQETIDWSMSVKEFLGWAQVNWQPGNFITLSPGAQGLSFSTDHGMILDILSPVNGIYGMLDRAGMPIDRHNVIVNRIDGEAKLISANNDVYSARLNIGELEHILIFDNITIFNDIIYDPLFNLRQPRLKIIGNRSTGWTGRLDAPGYMIIDNQIKSNYEKSATDLLTMWDIEEADNATLRDHSRHIIGYDSRDYLSNLVLSEVEQFEFYQGMIHQKGAPGAFDKLVRSDFIEQSRTLKFFEEWAFKIDEYGAVDTKDRIAFLFGQTAIKRDPQYVEFRELSPGTITTTPNPDWIGLTDSIEGGLDVKWVERPNDPMTAFPKRPNLDRQTGDLPVAGFVRLDEITHTVFSASDIETLYSNTVTLNAGEVVWVHNPDNSQIISNTATTTEWYLLGDQTAPGHWDGGVTRTLATEYTINQNGYPVFLSSPNEAPFVTTLANFDPIPGHTYNVTFTIRKTVRETNGIASYVRPAFDAFRTDGSVDGALGQKSGFGYDAVKDLIDTTNWVINKYYEVSAEWTYLTDPAIQYQTARGRIRVNRTYPADDTTTPYSNAQFELADLTVSLKTPLQWDALKIYNMSANGIVNTISKTTTVAEDYTLSSNIVRVHTVEPHGLTAADTGLFYVIDGTTAGDADVMGAHRIQAVGGSNFFDVAFTGVKGYSFVDNGITGPQIRIMRSIHFANLESFNSHKTRTGLADGDLAYVDGSPWMVFKRSLITETTDDYIVGGTLADGTISAVTFPVWNMVRVQPARIDATRINSSLLYNLQSHITKTDLQPEPLSLNHLTVVSPLCGIIPGLAAKEIDYMVDYDPARYSYLSNRPQMDGYVDYTMNADDTGAWGPAQVGRVWWDLSTVRFLETETDNVAYGMSNQARYNSEVNYRIGNWGQIAPGTSVDVYEWTKSTVLPTLYAAAVIADTTGTVTGEVYNASTPSYVQSQEYVGDTPTTLYYYWVKNKKTIPSSVPFRNMDVSTVSRFITNPLIEDQPWIAPIMPNGIIVGGTGPFVDDTFSTIDGLATSGTVLQIEVDDHNEGIVHDEWLLVRPGDERSLPPSWLWDKLRDSLVGFDDSKTLLPTKGNPLIVSGPVILPPVWNMPLGGIL